MENYHIIHSQLSSWNVHNKRVFLRADLNVPLENGIIRNDFRIKSILPTIDFLIKNHANIVLATHIGKPTNKEPDLSTRILIGWFEHHGYTIRFIADFMTIASMPIISGEILLIENLRFFPEEKDNNPFFAKQLATTAHYYINDAFGTVHEHACSTTVLPYEFSENKRTIGFLMQKELSAFAEITASQEHPFIAILGGGKMKSKIPFIKKLIDTIDNLLLGPAICFCFMKALHKNIGKSLVDDAMLTTCKEILDKAEYAHVPITLPIDYHIAIDSPDGPLQIIKADAFAQNNVGISIGPETVSEYTAIINQAKIVFFNCAMGFADRPETLESAKKIIAAMAQSSAKTIIAGGDSVDIALDTPHHSRITHLSTGGGAALAYLSGTMLPGLIPFEE